MLKLIFALIVLKLNLILHLKGSGMHENGFLMFWKEKVFLEQKVLVEK